MASAPVEYYLQCQKLWYNYNRFRHCSYPVWSKWSSRWCSSISTCSECSVGNYQPGYTAILNTIWIIIEWLTWLFYWSLKGCAWWKMTFRSDNSVGIIRGMMVLFVLCDQGNQHLHPLEILRSELQLLSFKWLFNTSWEFLCVKLIFLIFIFLFPKMHYSCLYWQWFPSNFALV